MSQDAARVRGWKDRSGRLDPALIQRRGAEARAAFNTLRRANAKLRQRREE